MVGNTIQFNTFYKNLAGFIQKTSVETKQTFFWYD